MAWRRLCADAHTGVTGCSDETSRRSRMPITVSLAARLSRRVSPPSRFILLARCSLWLTEDVSYLALQHSGLAAHGRMKRLIDGVNNLACDDVRS